MMNKRSILRVAAVGAAVAFAVAGLTACSSSGSATPAKKVTLTFWQNSTTGPGVQFWKTTIADFEKANKNITIDMQSIQNEDLDGKLQTAFNSNVATLGTAPGRRDELVAHLTQRSEILADLGCLAYEVGVNVDDPHTVFVIELWKSAEAQRNSLTLPEVRTSIDEARPLLSGEFGGFRFDVVGSPLHD
jgi:quinol monooxygenase YgiN